MLISPRAGSGLLADVAAGAGVVRAQRVGRQRRVRRRTPGRLRSVLGAVALVVLVVGGTAALWRWALTTPRFGVAHIEVRGASRVPVEAPLGTAALPITPLSSSTSHSTVGLPRESRISRPTISTIALILQIS